MVLKLPIKRDNKSKGTDVVTHDCCEKNLGFEVFLSQASHREAAVLNIGGAGNQILGGRQVKKINELPEG